MAGIRLPKSDDAIPWADWLELAAVTRADGNSSRGDLEGALRLSGYLEGAEAIEQRCNAVFLELNDRSRAASSAYPFAVGPSVIQIQGRLEDYPAYFFCLCLSYAGWDKKTGYLGARLFEDLSCLAAGAFVGGAHTRFAYPRTGRAVGLPTKFKEAIAQLTVSLAEGDGCRDKPSRSAKDDALDVVAWRHFPDLQPGKLLLVGQCASGDDWTDKLNDLNPVATTDEWMVSPIISPMLKAMFIPHRVRRDEWETCNRRAGLVFDRCRLAYSVHTGPNVAFDKYVTWTNDCLRRVLA